MTRALIMIILLGVTTAIRADADGEPTGTWSMELAPWVEPVALAHELGAIYRGSSGPSGRYHHFEFLQPQAAGRDLARFAETVEKQLAARAEAILWSEQQVRRPRAPRTFNRPADPAFANQWHLENVGQTRGRPGIDTGVLEVWSAGHTGNGVHVVVVDTGTDIQHADLAPNYRDGSNIFSGGLSPMPQYATDGHGTAVSGIIVAARNGLHGVGIAYDSSFSAVRLLSGSRDVSSNLTDAQESQALWYGHPTSAIYNNSWGPGNRETVRFSSPGTQTRNTILNNIQSGRNGRGAIYVWSAGNAAGVGDNANYDGYANNIHTIAVAAIGQDGIRADYSEPGACLLIAAPSQGRGAGILTTDVSGANGYHADDMTSTFSGTSAAAPMISGVIALMLDARPELGWRDVQFILARSAARTDPGNEDWTRNGAGLYVNHDYGYGRVDAAAAVAVARAWDMLPAADTVVTRSENLLLTIPASGWLDRSLSVVDNLVVRAVEIEVVSNHSDWGDLQIELISPAGTVSRLCQPHVNANPAVGRWTFTSMRHLDELCTGAWRLRLGDRGSGGTGRLTAWTLRVYGHPAQAGANRPPAGNDLEFAASVFPLTLDPLAGMHDPDADPLSIISILPPAHGTLVALADGTLWFNPGASPDGWDDLALTVTDGRGGVAHRVIRVLDERPIAHDDHAVTGSGVAVEIDLLANDVQPGPQVPAVLGVDPPRHGVFEILDGGVGRYTPDAGHAGVDRFQYHLAGGNSGWVIVTTEAGATDRALEFDGVSSQVRVAAADLPNLTGPCSIEGWIYPTSFGEYSTGFGRIFDKGNVIFFLNGADHAYYQDASLVFYLTLDDATNAAANSPANSVRLHAWQHVAVTFQPGALEPVRFYVDGVELPAGYPIDTAPRPAASANIADNTEAALYFGESATQARAFEGAISEVRYWQTIRNAGQIAAAATSRLSGMEAQLLLYYPFVEGVGPITAGLGANKAQGTIIGARWRPRVPAWQDFVDTFRPDYADGSGWYRMRGYGWLFGDFHPWIFHPSQGWLYAAGEPDSHWFWSAARGWWYTTPHLYPWAADAAHGWLYLSD